MEKNVNQHQPTHTKIQNTIISLSMSSRYLLVQFKDSIVVYRHERDDGDPENQDNKMQLIKTYEIPGSFEHTLFAITRTHIFSANDHTLTVFDLSGRAVCTFSFQAAITSVAGAVGEKDGAVVSCADGCVYYVIPKNKHLYNSNE